MTIELLAALFALAPGFVAAGIYYSLTSHPKPSQFERVVQALVLTVVVWVIAIPIASGLGIDLPINLSGDASVGTEPSQSS